MISKSTLEKAAEKNIIEPHQVDPLYVFITDQKNEKSKDGRDEPLKFIRSFGDIFISLGIILLLISINMTQLTGLYYLLPAAGFVVMAEWLVRVRRLVLPGMVILLSILYFVNKAILFDQASAGLLEFGLLSMASLLFYLRYKMPFSLLPLAASIVAMIIGQLGVDVLKHPLIFAGLGALVFCVAMWFDSRDTKRLSHLSDSAFWLHLLAAPLIVHGVMVNLLLSEQLVFGFLNKEVLIIVFFITFFMLALFVDRRAMLVSTQLYVIYSMTNIIQSTNIDSENMLIYILIFLGLFVIFFGTYWYKVRRLAFGFISGSPVFRYVPELEILDVKK